MSRLSDKINEVVNDDLQEHGSLEPHRAKTAIRPRLDAEDRETLVDEALIVRIKKAGTSGKLSALEVAEQPAQLRLFPDLHNGYAVDLEDRKIVQTQDLSHLEFRRIIKIRRDQIKNDAAHLKSLETTLAAVEPLWDANPAMVFGEICRLYEQHLRNPAMANASA